MTNEEFARSLVSLADYELMIETYRQRPMTDRGDLWFGTILRQRDLKRREAKT